MLELVQQIAAQVGVSEDQAQGGAGLIASLLQQQLGDDFAQLESAIPGMQGLADSAPSAAGMSSGLGGMLGGVASALGAGGLGNIAQLAGGFSKLGMDSSMVAQFIPVVLSFVQEKGGEGIAGLVANVLQGD